MDWTGSASQRKPQGVCFPPTKAPAEDGYRFTIPKGTKCEIRPVTKSEYRPYVTTKDVSFQRYESKREGRFSFRKDGWMIRVWWKQLIVKK